MLDENLARHHEIIDEARGKGAGLVVFPELGLTGYLLQDLAAEVAMRLDDPRLATLASAAKDLSVIASFVEESGDHRLFIAAALLEDGRIVHVHRKLYLPTYGLFDERRFFAAGDLLRAVPSRLGAGIGLAVMSRRRPAATSRRRTRSGSGRRRRGGTSCGPTPS